MPLYRPVDNDFLDVACPLGFWTTKEGIYRDFPDTKEVKTYNEEELASYLRSWEATEEEIELYK